MKLIKALFLAISFLLPVFAEEFIEYKIQPGDNLTVISRNFDISIKEIVNVNKELGLDTNKIFAGNKIFLPKKRELNYENFCFHPWTFKSMEKYSANKTYQPNQREEYSKKCLDKISANLDISFLYEYSNIDENTFWKKYFSDEGYSYYLLNSYYYLNEDFFCEEKNENIEDHNFSCINFFNKAAQKGDHIALSFLVYEGFPLTFEDYRNYDGPFLFDSSFGQEQVEMQLDYINKISITEKLKDYYLELLDFEFSNEAQPYRTFDDFIIVDNLKLLPYFERLDFLHNKFYVLHALGDKKYKIYLKAFEKEFFNYYGSYYRYDQIKFYLDMIKTLLWEGNSELAMSLQQAFAERIIQSNDFDLYENYEMFTHHLNNFAESDIPLNGEELEILSSLILYEGETTRAWEPYYFYDSIFAVREYQIQDISDSYKILDYTDEDIDEVMTEWKALTSTAYAFNGECLKAEKYHNDVFKTIKENGIEFYGTDTYFQPLTISSCFALDGNKTKLKEYNDEYIQVSRGSTLQSEIPSVARLYSVVLDSYYLMLNNEIKESKTRLKYFSNLFQKFLPSSTYIEAFDNMVFIYLKIYEKLNLHSDPNYADPILVKKVRNEIFEFNKEKNDSKTNLDFRINNQKGLLFATAKKISYLEERIGELSNAEQIELYNLYDKRKFISKRIISSGKDEAFTGFFENKDAIKNELDKEEFVLSYFSSSFGTFAYLLSSGKEHLVDIDVNKNQLKLKFSILNSEINDISDFNFEISKHLYDIVFEPIEKYLEKNSTIFLYDSPVIKTPMSILLKNYDVQEENLTKKIITANWLIDEYAFAKIIPVKSFKAEIFENNYLGLANSNSYSYLGNLPKLISSEKEIQMLAQSSMGNLDDILISQNATKENLLDKFKKSYKNIVLATHTVPEYWEGVVDEAALILGSGKGDYFLTSREISNLDIRTDMLVLSACGGNEEYTDLFKSFLEAGSNSIVHTNWDLESKFASEFTVDFFNNLWLAGNENKHLAMQKTAKDFLNNYSNEVYVHPSFWGNYTITYKTL